MKKILIIGATSAIAEATARLYAEDGARLSLIARNPDRLEAVAADLRQRGAESVETFVLDANEFERHETVLNAADEAMNGIDFALIAHGTLPDQAECQSSAESTRREFDTNCTSTISMTTILANLLEPRGAGSIGVITSVAGDRGRASNYVYGAAKGAVTLFLGGLRNRLHGSGIHVLTIKPGFVDTPMTADFPKGPLWAKPESIARGIHKAQRRRRDVVHLPGFWLPIMLIIRSIPERIFKRLSL
ncbi:MAG: SDR family oxidoreductase [Phycisphaerales bacterium]|nr:SDR family oxidoreductase [Phycisphaerales bacterium]